jgi:hypothetical protein
MLYAFVRQAGGEVQGDSRAGDFNIKSEDLQLKQSMYWAGKVRNLPQCFDCNFIPLFESPEINILSTYGFVFLN